MPLRIAELMRTAPDWVHADLLSAEVTGWLDRAYQTVREIDPIEAGCLQVYAQHLRTDVRRHSAEIIATMHRVELKLLEERR